MLHITDGNTTYLLDCPSYEELITYYTYGRKERERYRVKSKAQYIKRCEKKLKCEKLTDVKVETIPPA
jgi:hypothetical protein